MNTKSIFKLLLMGVLIFTMERATGQVSWLGNAGGPTDYLGWNNVQNFPLQIRHDNNQQIQLFTNNVRRMQLLPTESYTIGGFTGQSKSGSLLLARDVAAFYSGGAPGPFTRLHLADTPNGTQQSGYRSNMQNGVTMTGNNDQMYVGQLYHGLDYTDAAIVWSDNPGGYLADRLTFNFTSSYNSAATSGNNSFRGLQTLLVQPAASGDEAFVGVGDFDAAGATPNERLDVLDGKVRIRQLPTDPANDTLDKYMVVGNDGVVHWRPLPPFASSGCEWVPNAGANRLTTATAAVGNNGSCPEQDWRVGIGAADPEAKLHVMHDGVGSGSGLLSGVYSDLYTNNTGTHTGVTARVRPANGATVELESAAGVWTRVQDVGTTTGLVTATSYGVYGLSTTAKDVKVKISSGVTGHGVADASTIHGLYGGYFDGLRRGGAVTNVYGAYCSGTEQQPRTEGLATSVFGVHGVAKGGATNYGVAGNASSAVASDVCYAVFGWAGGPDDPNGPNGHTKWAGYFQGNTYSPGMVWTASDEQLKRNIEDLPQEVAVAKLMELEPKTYDFDQGQFGFMNLPTEHQYGLIAQNVRSVLPELVTNIHQPARLDTAGVEVAPAIDFSAMNYQGLIPLLVAGFKQQQATTAGLQEQVGQLQDQLAAMQQQLAACCANPGGDRLQQQPANTTGTMLDDTNDRKLRIVPNPFNEPPTVYYTMERGGRMQLLVNSADGRDLKVLHEATQEKGDYQFQWDTNALAPGMYYVTLLIDSQPVVSKAVKVGR